jgi:hypothetical protein
VPYRCRGIQLHKGISAVIAAVIILATAITVSVAVAIWMGGISTTYTKFEKVQIVSAVCTKNAGNWTLSFNLKNTGTTTSTLIEVFVNDVEVDAYGSGAVPGSWTTNMTKSQPLVSGASTFLEVYISGTKAGSSLSSSTMVNIKFHSAGGMDYVSMLELI